MNAGRILNLGTPLVDWITLTSYSEVFSEYWTHLSDKAARESDVVVTQRMQYVGKSYDTGRGALFLGEAVQRGRRHWMIQVSDEMADEYIAHTLYSIRYHDANCTRVDMQITEVEPEYWSQFDFLTRMKGIGGIVEWRESESEGRRWQTVYIGSRTSDRFVRVYQKETDARERLLRFEVEVKSARAMAVMRRIAEGHTVRQLLLAETQRVNDQKVREIFEPALVGVLPVGAVVKRRSSAARQELWLRNVALPALRRYANSAEHSELLIREFREVLEHGTYKR